MLAGGQDLDHGSVLAARDQSGQRGVFLTVCYRVQAEHGRLRRRIHFGRMQAQSSFSRCVRGKDGDPAGRLPVALGQRRVGPRSHRSQAYKV